MAQNIFLDAWRIGSFGGGRARLFGEFGFAKGGPTTMEWTPKWLDVAALVVEAVDVEKRNLPGSKYLEQFAEVCRTVVTKYAPVASAARERLKINSYYRGADGKMYADYDKWTGIKWWNDSGQTYEVLMPLTSEALQAVLKSAHGVDAIVWNGAIIEMTLAA